MPSAPELDDLRTMTARYYQRVRELLGEVPESGLAARIGKDGMPVNEMLGHIARSDLWYLNLIDGGKRELVTPVPQRQALLDVLAHSEREMLTVLGHLAPAALNEHRTVPTWWAAQSDCTVRVILMHSLAHKYYHSGQLQSILFDLQARGRTTT